MVMKQATTSTFTSSGLLTVLFTTLIIFYTVLVVHVTKKTQRFSHLQQLHSASQINHDSRESLRQLHFPSLLIYRRTMKTGSSSMREALLQALQPYGYNTLPYKSKDLQVVLRHLFVRKDLIDSTSSVASRSRLSKTSGISNISHFFSVPQNYFARTEKDLPAQENVLSSPRVLLVQHNDITKSVHPTRDAIIVDTFRPGYAQITSFCTHIQRVSSCSDLPSMEACLLSNVTKAQNFYRWAGRSAEDCDTYIDLPLSSSHPALSTTVFRTLFPDTILNLNIYNQRGSTCPEHERLKRIYDEHYTELENQVRSLQHRLLVIAGYPTMISRTTFGSKWQRQNFTYEDMLDAAESEERQKYPELNINLSNVKEASQEIQNFQGDLKRWIIDSHGNLISSSKKKIAKTQQHL